MIRLIRNTFRRVKTDFASKINVLKEWRRMTGTRDFARVPVILMH